MRCQELLWKWYNLLIYINFLSLYPMTLHGNVKTSPQIQKGENPSPSLPKGKDQDLVIGMCTGCHSAGMIAQHRMTRVNWDKTITWMQKNHNLWEIPQDLRQRILDYLGTFLSPLSHHADSDPMDQLTPRNVNPLPET